MFHIPLTVLSLSTLSCTMSCSRNYTNYKNENDDDSDYINSDNFFPKLYQVDYYDYLEFDENAKPVIGDKFIMQVISDVVSRVASSNGNISYTITKHSNSSVDFHFKWTYKNKILYKTYSFYM